MARRRRDEDPDALAERVLAGDRRAVARAISLAEDENPAARRVLEILYPHAGKARTLGITGPPGVGKSSLIAALCTLLRARDQTVGVITVDPSSHITHGALLGDRIRLVEHFLDRGVYIRSMGTRGHLGGVAEATLLAGVIVDASGRDVLAVRDGRRGAERGRGRRARRHRGARADARLGRLDPGAQGRRHGDPRRDRRQQGRSPGHRAHARRARAGALAGRSRAPPRRDRDRRHRARPASRSSGTPSRSTSARSPPAPTWPSAARPSCARSCSRWRRRARRAGWARCSTAAPISRASSTRWPSAASTRSRPCSSCSSAHDDPRGRLRLPPHARAAAGRHDLAPCTAGGAGRASRSTPTVRQLGRVLNASFPWETPEERREHGSREVARAYFEQLLDGGCDRRRRRRLRRRRPLPLRPTPASSIRTATCSIPRPARCSAAVDALGLRQIVLSNHVWELPEICIALGLLPPLAEVLTSARLSVEKPHPETYAAAIAAAGLRARTRSCSSATPTRPTSPVPSGPACRRCSCAARIPTPAPTRTTSPACCPCVAAA